MILKSFENLKLDVGGKMLNDWVIKYRKDFDRKRWYKCILLYFFVVLLIRVIGCRCCVFYI